MDHFLRSLYQIRTSSSRRRCDQPEEECNRINILSQRQRGASTRYNIINSSDTAVSAIEYYFIFISSFISAFRSDLWIFPYSDNIVRNKNKRRLTPSIKFEKKLCYSSAGSVSKFSITDGGAGWVPTIALTAGYPRSMTFSLPKLHS